MTPQVYPFLFIVPPVSYFCPYPILLSPFIGDTSRIRPLPFPCFFSWDLAIACSLTCSELKTWRNLFFIALFILNTRRPSPIVLSWAVSVDVVHGAVSHAVVAAQLISERIVFIRPPFHHFREHKEEESFRPQSPHCRSSCSIQLKRRGRS